jgi:hypothetical protein
LAARQYHKLFAAHQDFQMTDSVPSSTQRQLQFENGSAIGTSQRWVGGQYCSVLTPVGIVGCGIYDLKTAEEFGQAIAIAKGTPTNPLVEIFLMRRSWVSPQKPRNWESRSATPVALPSKRCCQRPVPQMPDDSDICRQRGYRL